MRSLLFVPGDSEKKLEKALSSSADALILDLEDSVSPSRKQAAREMVAAFLQDAPEGGPRLYVRINDLGSAFADDDLTVTVGARPEGIILPKSDGGTDVVKLSARLNVHEAEAGLPEGITKIIAIATETAMGTLSMASYCNSTPRLVGLTWGAEDLSAAIGARTARDENSNYTDPFRLARALTLLGAAAADVAAIDTVYVDLKDDAGLERECAAAERDGFTAKLAIHPAQIPVINAAFTPSPEAIDKARRIVEAFAAAPETGVAALDGEMVDRPHLKRAERLLARAASSL
ncbi:CoA ester lyase [Phyllobacterium phragmitis]|uniref:CoA ester lyase n=1 Tax=Phyllobacterium phragmitis TaxID=2670329 RepID=A0A2S9IP22_9HYPH|nr:CoA ester lyase [Phyllobacterium phragmitis]PRD42277.1 CoA ester lyase [Phyllobacterium phragmitis]